MSAVRHKANTKVRAVELRNAGWSARKVQEQLAKEGCDPLPSPTTILFWANGDEADRRRQYLRAWTRRWRAEQATVTWPAGLKPTVEWKLARIRSLAEFGMDIRSIAEAMNHDFPGDEALTRGQVEGVVLYDRVPRSYRRQRREREKALAS